MAERPVLPVSQPKYLSYEVPGRNGKLTVFDGYEDVPIRLRFNFIKQNVKPTFRDVVNFLTGKSKFRLSDDNRYRVIAQPVINVSDGNNDIPGWCDFEIEFITEPFEYEDATMQSTTTNTVIVNPSNIEAGVIGDGTDEGKDVTFTITRTNVNNAADTIYLSTAPGTAKETDFEGFTFNSYEIGANPSLRISKI